MKLKNFIILLALVFLSTHSFSQEKEDTKAAAPKEEAPKDELQNKKSAWYVFINLNLLKESKLSYSIGSAWIKHTYTHKIPNIGLGLEYFRKLNDKYSLGAGLDYETEKEATEVYLEAYDGTQGTQSLDSSNTIKVGTGSLFINGYYKVSDRFNGFAGAHISKILWYSNYEKASFDSSIGIDFQLGLTYDYNQKIRLKAMYKMNTQKWEHNISGADANGDLKAYALNISAGYGF